MQIIGETIEKFFKTLNHFVGIDIYLKSLNPYDKRIGESLLGSYFLQESYKLILFVTIAFLLCSILAIVAYVFSLGRIKDSEKLSEYECGFEPFDNATRLPFDVHFYIVGILFLIFDVEIAILFPWILGIQSTSWMGFYSMMLFLVILTLGFIYEWRRGALSWPPKNI